MGPLSVLPDQRLCTHPWCAATVAECRGFDVGRHGGHSRAGRAEGAPTPRAPRVLYLDMNVWVDMTRGCANDDGEWQQVRDHLARAVQARQITLPLSAAHYLELWHRRKATSRRQVAELMRDLTGYATMPSAHVVRQLEAEAIVRMWAHPTATEPATNDLMGYGAAHAFGRADGRFRFVESIASKDGMTPEGSATDPPAGWDILRKRHDWEWLQLFGTEELVAAESGLDLTPEHRFGSAQVDHELVVRDWLRAHPEARHRFRDIVIAEEFESMREYIEDACAELRVRPPSPLRTARWGPESARAIQAVVSAAPSADTWSTLRFLKHRDLNLPWEQHDWTDLWSLSVAIPYCDVVITEKRWAHLATIGGLTRRYGTVMGHGRQAVERELDRAL